MSEVDKLEDGGKLFEAIDKVDDGKVANDIGKAKKNLKNAENDVSLNRFLLCIGVFSVRMLLFTIFCSDLTLNSKFI